MSGRSSVDGRNSILRMRMHPREPTQSYARPLPRLLRIAETRLAWRGRIGFACSGAVGLETGCAVRVQRRGYCALFRVGVHTLRDWTCVREGHRLSPPDDRQGEFLPDLFMYVDRRLVLRSCIVLCVKGIVDSENDSRMLID